MIEKKYVTLKVAFEIYGIPVSTLRRKIAIGELEAYKPGRNLMVELRAMDLYVKRSKVDCAS